ncbi:hypothetical protein GH714_031118 [Hevea brasiliensis]|uniref:FAM50A/XAP5 C-terminal domain-containing protein n=2 Tax=Magnoliopsida TaxID=3398 RepID=A0A6A6LNZ3_HEVBR|nr:hypothetical protein GH714_031118 [Hevea brasiliensis]
MSGMGDGYVGTAQDAVRIRRLEKQREAERRKIQELKTKSASAKGQPGLLQFGSSTSEVRILNRLQSVPLRYLGFLRLHLRRRLWVWLQESNMLRRGLIFRIKLKEEEKEKLQKLRQEEEELQLEKRKKRKIKVNPRLSFADDIENGSEEEDAEDKGLESNRLVHGKFGKDPTVETSFLPDRGDEDAFSVSGRQRSKLSVKDCGNSGFMNRNRFEVRKGDTIGEFLRAVQQQLAPEFREIRTTSVENLLYVKEDLIIPHQHSFYELIVNKARGKSGPLFHFDVHEDVRTIADATIEKDESHAGKVVERHCIMMYLSAVGSGWSYNDLVIDHESSTWHFDTVVSRAELGSDSLFLYLFLRAELGSDRRETLRPYAPKSSKPQPEAMTRCQSDSDAEVTEAAEEVSDLGIVGEDAQYFGDGSFSPAPGVDTVCVFPKNSARLVPAGEDTELLVGLKNDGESSINIIAIKASVHLPFDHRLLVQNLTAQAFNNATVPVSTQATFPYIFSVSKYLQPGSFDLVGTIFYEMDQHPYQSTFYNGTIEVLSLVASSVLSQFFLLPLELPFLDSLVYGFMVKYRTFLRKRRGLQRWKLELGLGMPQWMNGYRELHTLSHYPANLRRRSNMLVAYSAAQGKALHGLVTRVGYWRARFGLASTRYRLIISGDRIEVYKLSNFDLPKIGLIVQVGSFGFLINRRHWCFPNGILPLFRAALLCFYVSALFSATSSYGDNDKSTTVEVIGIGECADCAESNIQTSQALSGLRVTIDCKPENGKFKTRGAGELDEEGKFKVILPSDLVKDEKLKEECYAQLRSASATPCPAHSGLESSKIIFKSKSNGKHTFGLAGKLKFSPVTCTSTFLWPHFKFHHCLNGNFLHRKALAIHICSLLSVSSTTSKGHQPEN